MSKIFRPYRALGQVCNEIPFVLRYHPYHKEIYILAPVGRCIHTYALKHLAIKAISDELPENITAITASNKYVIAAAGNRLYSLKFSRSVIREFRVQGNSSIRHLENLDDDYFISVDEEGSVIVWNAEEDDPVIVLKLGSLSRFVTSAIMHPVSYKNKVLLGSSDGRLCLWNIRRNIPIYDFSLHIQEEIGTPDKVPITCLVQGPAPHLVAIGREDGRIIILHLKTAKVVWMFRQEWGSVTSLSFRRDGVDQMLSGSCRGYVTIWRLEKNSTVGGGKEWHQEPVTGLQCVYRQPLVVSSSADNHLKVWSYEDSGPGDPDVTPRVLYRREGHCRPPSVLRYVGIQGENILSGGRDSSLRVFSTLHERFNRQFGRAYRRTAKSASGRKKQRRAVNSSSTESETLLYPEFSDLAVESSRSEDWDTIASCHSDTLQITTWNYRKGTQGQHHLVPKEFIENPGVYKYTYASCVTVSSCGNFVTIGYSSGHVYRFNIQSGMERVCYVDEGSSDRKAHCGAVTGVCSNLTDQIVITSGGAGDRRVRSWASKKGRLLNGVELDSHATLMRIHREADAVIVGLEDGSILLLNVNTLVIVRRLFGHPTVGDSISELCFFPDAKWLTSFGASGSVKTWDLIHGKLIDWFTLAKPVVSAAISPTADFLATAHDDDLGIYLWSNQALYKPLTLTPIPEDAKLTDNLMDLPTASLRSGDKCGSVPDGLDEALGQTLSHEQLSEELITLSNVAESRWRHLRELDTIRERNKPVEAPRVPKQVPFFIAAVDDQGRLKVESETKEEKVNETADRILNASISRLTPYLDQVYCDGGGKKVVEFLETLGPSAIDLEIQMLTYNNDSSDEALVRFLHAILSCVRQRCHFDTCQAYLSLFLHHYGILSSKSEQLRSVLKDIEEATDSCWTDAQEQMDEVDVMCNLALGQLPYVE